MRDALNVSQPWSNPLQRKMASTLFYGLLLVLAVAMLAAADDTAADAAASGADAVSWARASGLGFPSLSIMNSYKLGTPHHCHTRWYRDIFDWSIRHSELRSAFVQDPLPIIHIDQTPEWAPFFFRLTAAAQVSSARSQVSAIDSLFYRIPGCNASVRIRPDKYDLFKI